VTKSRTLTDVFSFLKKDHWKDDHESFFIAGLGNPGKEYENNRHNIGFMALNRFVKKYGETFSKYEKKGLIAKFQVENNRLILVKPQTFMNLSGQAIGPLVRYYKIPLDNVLITYDDIDLPFGAIRIRPSGGAGGHKGLSSVINKLGTNNFPRMRLGIGRPPGNQNAANYVLKNFSPSETDTLEIVLENSCEAMQVFLRDGIEAAMNKFNTSVVL
jgi:PTH1 family peptidyl-tRNA hydrolase